MLLLLLGFLLLYRNLFGQSPQVSVSDISNPRYLTFLGFSGGFIDVIEPLLKSLKLDFYRANQLEIKDGKLTGGLLGQVIDRKAKKNALEEFARLENVSISQSVAVGDGANDLDMIEAAGLGVAFNAKPKVAAAAATTISNYDLSTLLLLMGISS